MKRGSTPSERFDAWYVKAIEKLKELPEGDGAFAALMIALPLYERYITAKLKLEGKTIDEEALKLEIGRDLRLTDGQRRVFWDVFRVGFTHHGMGKRGKTKWRVSHLGGALPVFCNAAGEVL